MFYTLMTLDGEVLAAGLPARSYREAAQDVANRLQRTVQALSEEEEEDREPERFEPAPPS